MGATKLTKDSWPVSPLNPVTDEVHWPWRRWKPNWHHWWTRLQLEEDGLDEGIEANAFDAEAENRFLIELDSPGQTWPSNMHRSPSKSIDVESPGAPAAFSVPVQEAGPDTAQHNSARIIQIHDHASPGSTYATQHNPRGHH